MHYTESNKITESEGEELWRGNFRDVQSFRIVGFKIKFLSNAGLASC